MPVRESGVKEVGELSFMEETHSTCLTPVSKAVKQSVLAGLCVDLTQAEVTTEKGASVEEMSS